MVKYMMFVVKTIQQLSEALEQNAQELMIIGQQAPEILEAINRPLSEQDRNPVYPILSRVNDNFEVLELIDNGQNVEGILRQKPVLS